MYSQEKLLQMLTNKKASVRYEACEWLRVSQESSPEVVRALQVVTQDNNKDVAERAKYALQAEVHHSMAIKTGIIEPMEPIIKVVQIYRKYPELDDKALYDLHISEGVDRQMADDLMTFIPLAYTKVLFAEVGINYKSFFRRLDDRGNLLPGQLSDVPLWNETIAYAQKEITSGVSRKDMALVAHTSSEFKAISDIKMKGIKPTSTSLEDKIIITLSRDIQKKK